MVSLSPIQGQASLFHARERRRSLAGVPELFRSHQIFGGTAMPVASIDTGAIFPSRSGLVTFKTAIRITENSGEHRGLVFEFGDSATGVALWIGDETIGFHAGDDGDADGATALYDLGAELPVGAEYSLTAAVRSGDGRVRLWANGTEIARATATNESIAAWAADSAGSFAAAAQGTVVADVPVASQGAPTGFTVIEPLSVYVNQIPRHFV